MVTQLGLMATILASGAAAQAPAPAAPSPRQAPCAAPAYRQLDFWVGEWRVFDTASGAAVGNSRIERTMNGCAIQEHYEAPNAPQGAYSGASYSGFDRKDGKWHQLYVDTNGNVSWFAGGLEGADMVMIATAGAGALNKMIYRRHEDGSVEQIGQRSSDGGRTWRPGYDYTYRASRTMTHSRPSVRP